MNTITNIRISRCGGGNPRSPLESRVIAVVHLNTIKHEFGKPVMVNYLKPNREVDTIVAIGIKDGTGPDCYSIISEGGKLYVGGVYEEHTFQRMTVNDTGRGPKLYSEQTTTSTSRRGPQGQQLKSTQRTITASRTVPAQSREYRKEIRQNSGHTNNRNATEMRSNKTITTTTKMTTRSNSRPANARGTTSTTTTTTTTSKTVTRGRSTGGLRGKQ